MSAMAAYKQTESTKHNNTEIIVIIVKPLCL